ncbi:hypothetical protein [Candidatus Hodarchaeum mangrovi]
MFRLDIITKAGILVFSHSFINPLRLEENSDQDMQASLITAVLNTLKETQGETITAIHQVGYKLLLYEGILTFGILTISGEDESKLHNFLRSIVLKFELMFTYELHIESVINRTTFESFRKIIKNMYEDMIGVEFNTLHKLLEILKYSNISNLVVFETNFFHPILTSIVDHSIDFPLDKIIRIFREIDNLSLSEKKDNVTCSFDLQSIIIHGLKIRQHWIACFSSPNHVSKFIIHNEIEEIKNSLLFPEALSVS